MFAPVAFEMTTLESAEGHKSLSPRALVNGLTLATVLALLAASIPLWIGAARQAWARQFPPPAYTGALLFTEAGSQLTALRTTDGSVQWTLWMNLQESNVFQYNDTLYIAQYTVNQVITIAAVRARDGHLLWQSTRQGYNVPEVIGIQDGNLVDLYQSDPTGNEILVALDIHTGQTRWVTPEMTSAEVYLAENTIILCQYDISSDGQTAIYAMTALDSLTGKQHWSHTLSLPQSEQGYVCGTTATRAIIALNPGALGALYSYDVQTGALSWHAQVGPNIETFDQDRVYLSTWTGSAYPDATAGDRLRALRAGDGAMLWSAPGQYLPMQYGETLFPDIVLARTPDGLAGLDARTGTVKWTWTPASANTSDWNYISGRGNMLYYGDQTGVYAFDEQSGRMLWQRDGQNALFSAAAAYQQIYISGQQHLLAVNASNGKLRWQIPVAGITQFVYCPTCR